MYCWISVTLFRRLFESTIYLLFSSDLSIKEEERAKALVNAGADVIVIDSSQGDSIYQCDLIKRLKSCYPELDVGLTITY